MLRKNKKSSVGIIDSLISFFAFNSRKTQVELAESKEEIIFDINSVAKQANGVLVKKNSTVLLCTCVVGDKILSDFAQLSVHYLEKFSAVNKIPGGYKKREGPANDNEILIARSIDKALRPIIPSDFFNEVQITIHVFSYDESYALDVLAIAGASVSMNLAGVTKKLVAAAKIQDDSINIPVKNNQISLLQAVSDEKIVMLEFTGNSIESGSLLQSSINESIKNIVKLQQKALKEANKILVLQQKVLNLIDSSSVQQENIKLFFLPEIVLPIVQNILTFQDAKCRKKEFEQKKRAFIRQFHSTEEQIGANYFFKQFFSEQLAKKYLQEKIRLDGRKFDQLRLLNMQINFLPNLHGSAFFSRGEKDPTQALVSVTIGELSDSQMIETIGGISKDNFLLHYNFMPYCVYETGRANVISRREIGHGELAKRALLSLIPRKLNYSIRIVSDITASNGSSSMATICAASLALHEAGIQLNEHVAGISVGLIEYSLKSNKKNKKLLLDISGEEDMFGCMDFKIAGTKNAITAMQLDIKNEGLEFNLCEQAMKLAVKNIRKILQQMNKMIKKPNEMMHVLHKKMIIIDKAKIKEVIGKNGVVINALCSEFDVRIDVDKSGKIFISGKNIDKVLAVMNRIKTIAE